MLNGGGESFLVDPKWNCKGRTVRLGMFANLIGALFIAQEESGEKMNSDMLPKLLDIGMDTHESSKEV